MSESTLSIDRDEILSEMAHVAGWSRSSSDWSTAQSSRLDIALKRAMRQAYWPDSGHDWTFLRPVVGLTTWITLTGTISSATYDGSAYTTIVATAGVFYDTVPGHSFVVGSSSYTIDSYTSSTTVSVVGDASAETGTFSVTATDTFRAPDNFESVVGNRMVYAADSNCNRRHISQVSIEDIERMRSDELTGSPHSYAVVPVVNNSGNQRWDFVFYPKPNAAYVVRMRQRIQPNVLTASNEYPYGPTWFGKVLLSSARAEIEKEIFKAPGVWYDDFMRDLASAQVMDKRNEPQSLGPIEAPTLGDGLYIGIQAGRYLPYE